MNSLIVDGHKPCSVCRENKPISEYYFSTTGRIFGPCKPCNRKRSDDWRKNNSKAFNAIQRKCYHKNPLANRRIWLKKNYGITPEQYDATLTEQGGGCAICGSPHKLHMDHNHKTKRLRGLLCSNCNLGLGNLQENQAIMAKAIAYLQFHEASPSPNLANTGSWKDRPRRKRKLPPSAIN